MKIDTMNEVQCSVFKIQGVEGWIRSFGRDSVLGGKPIIQKSSTWTE